MSKIVLDQNKQWKTRLKIGISTGYELQVLEKGINSTDRVKTIILAVNNANECALIMLY